MTVRELLSTIGSDELAEWMAYYDLEPWGGARGDLQAGIVASVMCNLRRDRRVRPTPFAPADFLLKFGDDPEEPVQQTPEEAFDALSRALGLPARAGLED